MKRNSNNHDKPLITDYLSPRRIGNGATLNPEIWSADHRARLPKDDPTRIAAEKEGFRENGTTESVTELDVLLTVARELLEIS